MAGSTRRIHTAGGPLDIVVDNNSTAGDFGSGWITLYMFLQTKSYSFSNKNVDIVQIVAFWGEQKTSKNNGARLLADLWRRYRCKSPSSSSDEPWHGNTLLSCGPEKFQQADAVKDDGKDLTLANYSMLATPGRLQIATERKWHHHPTDPGTVGLHVQHHWLGEF